MSHLLFAPTVTLLAHKRLTDLVLLLERKSEFEQRSNQTTGFNRVLRTDVDRRVEALARGALAILGGGPDANLPSRLILGQPDAASGLPRIGQYALLGSSALHFPEMVDYFGPNQGWMLDVLRRSSPDPDLSRVVTVSTDLPFLIAAKALPKTTDDIEQAKIRAFAMGMLCAVAGEVIVSPLLRGLHGRRSQGRWSRHDPADLVRVVDARLARDLLGGVPDTDAWDALWPTAEEIPTSLLEGFVEALEELYGINHDHRPKGFGVFESRFTSGPNLDVPRLRQAYTFYRFGLEQRQLGAGGWWGVLNAFWWPPLIALMLGLAIPTSRPLFQDDADVTQPPGEKAWFALTMIACASSFLTPLILAMVMWAKVPGEDGPFIEALILGIIRALLIGLGIGGLAADWSTDARWYGITPFLAVADVYAAFRAIIDSTRGLRGNALAFGLQTYPILSVLVTMGIVGLVRLTGEHRLALFLSLWFSLLLILLLAVGIPIAFLIRDNGGLAGMLLEGRDTLAASTALDDATVNRADLRALLRLFDDSTLWAPPGTMTPSLADLHFPSGPRPLIRIWWTGEGDVKVTHTGRSVTFIEGDTTHPPVNLPMTPFTAVDLAQDLQNGLAGIQTEVIDPDPQRYTLPFPITLDVRSEATDLGTSRDDAYLLRHTPRAPLSSRIGRAGASAIEREGLTVVPDATLAELDDSAVGLGGDLATLLALGAAPTLTNTPLRPDGIANAAPLDEVYQVFRRWNLDERRINEWRMLVLGDAASEKNGRPRDLDPANRQPASGTTYTSPFANDNAATAAETTARQLGWIPTFRAWYRIATDPRERVTNLGPADYNPRIRRTGGHTNQVTNNELSEALRYLLELP
ncbi:MAG: hypothetical protein AAGD38_03220 [Acidobacteriota bacterium]